MEINIKLKENKDFIVNISDDMSPMTAIGMLEIASNMIFEEKLKSKEGEITDDVQ